MKWISIKDKLPEADKDVLLLTDSGVTSGSLSSKDSEWYFITLDVHGCGCCGGDNDEVTHWQELPKAPSNK